MSEEVEAPEPEGGEPEPERVGILGTQEALFDIDPKWKEHWAGMPECDQKDQAPWKSIYVHFATPDDRRAFGKLVGQPITDRTRSIWYPKAEIRRMMDKRYATAEAVDPKYPVYIISKGRWESRLTAKSLEAIGVPYSIVIEPQEYDQYAAVISPAKILVLPFSNLGQGSIPARNWVWEHAVSTGAERHWILDDNIDGFFRLNDNLKVPVSTGATFRAAEDFSDRYTNVAISGFNYFMFASRKTVIAPFTLNTRIYSCILIRNDIPYRWRGRYNEDTDLSIRALKDGYCTVLFNAFLAMKQTTMTMKGGNTEALYNIKEGEKDGRLLMAESLQEQHPDIVQITRKWGRWQHHVNYKPFRRNKLEPKPDLVIGQGTDNYGMELKILADADPALAYEEAPEMEEAQEAEQELTNGPTLPMVDEGYIEIPPPAPAEEQKPCFHIPACPEGRCKSVTGQDDPWAGYNKQTGEFDLFAEVV